MLTWIGSAQSQTHQQLQDKILQISKSASGKVGVAFRILESGDTLSFNDEDHYPMQSVFKFPIGICVLKAAEMNQLSLDSMVFIRKSDLRKTVSALYEKYPQGNVKVSVKEMLTDMITLSDNNACDILMRLVGGPQKITAVIHKLGVKSIQIVGDEASMSADWPVQYRNWSKPSAQVTLLRLLYQHMLLHQSGTSLLIHLMEQTFVAPKRIRGLLPKGTILAHRSGTSATNDAGLSPATNDIGVITLPGGQHLAVAIFLKNSYLDNDKRDEIIARIALAAYEYASKQSN